MARYNRDRAPFYLVQDRFKLVATPQLYPSNKILVPYIYLIYKGEMNISLFREFMSKFWNVSFETGIILEGVTA